MVLGMAIAQQAATGLSLREQVAAEVRAWRARLKITQKEMGAVLGLSQASVSAIYTAVAQREIRANDPGRPRPAGHRGVTGPRHASVPHQTRYPAGRRKPLRSPLAGCRLEPAGPPRVIRSDPGGAGRGYCARMPLHEGSREGTDHAHTSRRRPGHHHPARRVRLARQVPPAPNEGPSPIPEHLIRDWLDTNYRGADWTTAGISRIDDSPALTLVATTYPGDADAYRIGPGMCSAVRAAPGPWPARRRGVGAVGGGPPHRKVLIR